MKVVSCDAGKTEVSPKMYNACTFEIIDKWDPKQHAKTCDTMFYLRDGTGAYVWDCDQWIFLDFSGYTAPDWNAKENQQGYIKNKPFEKLGEFLEVSSDGVLSVNITPADIGAATKEDLDNHTKDEDNPHGVTATQVGAYSKTESDGRYAKKEDLTSHVNDKENPHEVTAGQTGAFTKEESSANVINIITGKDEVEMIFNFDLMNKIAGSFVENKNIYRYVSIVSGTLPVNPSVGTELGNAGDWLDYSSVGALDNKLFTTNTPTATRSTLHLIRWNILEVVKEMMGDKFFDTFGAKNTTDQLSLIRKKASSLTMGVWGYGKNQSGYRLTIKTQRASDSAWAYEGYHTKSTVQKLTTTIIPTSIPYYINDDGFVTVGAYAEASDGTGESLTRVDYANAEFRMKLSMDEYLKSMIAAYHGENPPEWSEVTKKPFETIGDNLEVVDGKLNATGGAGKIPSWSAVTEKPFETVGKGLGVDTDNNLYTTDQYATTEEILVGDRDDVMISPKGLLEASKGNTLYKEYFGTGDPLLNINQDEILLPIGPSTGGSINYEKVRPYTIGSDTSLTFTKSGRFRFTATTRFVPEATNTPSDYIYTHLAVNDVYNDLVSQGSTAITNGTLKLTWNYSGSITVDVKAGDRVWVRSSLRGGKNVARIQLMDLVVEEVRATGGKPIYDLPNLGDNPVIRRDDLAGLVDVTTDQTIEGVKDFTDRPTVNGDLVVTRTSGFKTYSVRYSTLLSGDMTTYLSAMESVFVRRSNFVDYFGRFDVKTAGAMKGTIVTHAIPPGYRQSALTSGPIWNIPFKVCQYTSPQGNYLAMYEGNSIRIYSDKAGNHYVHGSWYTEDAPPS